MPSFVIPGGKEEYSKWTGFVYIFNLIVGLGALTLPYAFGNAGWLVSLFVISALAFMSYVTVTFVVESMATTNAILYIRKLRQNQKVEYELPESHESENDELSPSEMTTSEQDHDHTYERGIEEREPLLENSAPHRLPMPIDYYSIEERVEMGQMMALYFKRLGVTLFYICICLYLYGDLAIYATAVAKSLRDVTCTYVPELNISSGESVNSTSQCWPNSSITRSVAYRLYILVFLILLGPFVFFNIQKTKHLQILTTILRWLAFLAMIILTLIHLGKGGVANKPSLIKIRNLPEMFGTCVYSFMCHHSLPSLVTPVNDKRRIQSLFAADYFLILCFYVFLSMTAVFTFHTIFPLYSLNFEPGQPESIVNVPVIQYFIVLFPVFTLSTNFPIIGITLRNNLQVLLLNENSSYLIRRILLPFITILPPIIISLLTENIEVLVGVTGSYAGAGIQYIIPVFLVYRSRKLAHQVLGVGVKNSHASVFRHRHWLTFVIVWAISCIILVTINDCIKLFG